MNYPVSWYTIIKAAICKDIWLHILYNNMSKYMVNTDHYISSIYIVLECVCVFFCLSAPLLLQPLDLWQTALIGSNPTHVTASILWQQASSVFYLQAMCCILASTYWECTIAHIKSSRFACITFFAICLLISFSPLYLLDPCMVQECKWDLWEQCQLWYSNVKSLGTITVA